LAALPLLAFFGCPLSPHALYFSTPRVTQSQTSGLGAVAAMTRSSYGGNSSARSCNGAKSSAEKPSARPLPRAGPSYSTWPRCCYNRLFTRPQWRSQKKFRGGAVSSEKLN
jgi:hypothetical protein